LRFLRWLRPGSPRRITFVGRDTLRYTSGERFAELPGEMTLPPGRRTHFWTSRPTSWAWSDGSPITGSAADALIAEVREVAASQGITLHLELPLPGRAAPQLLPGEVQRPFVGERDRLLLETDVGQIEVRGQPHWVRGQPAFRPDVPVQIGIDGRELGEAELRQAVELLVRAAEVNDLLIEWPAGYLDHWLG
jgi:hypothetical protein